VIIVFLHTTVNIFLLENFLTRQGVMCPNTKKSLLCVHFLPTSPGRRRCTNIYFLGINLIPILVDLNGITV